MQKGECDGFYNGTVQGKAWAVAMAGIRAWMTPGFSYLKLKLDHGAIRKLRWAQGPQSKPTISANLFTRLTQSKGLAQGRFALESTAALFVSPDLLGGGVHWCLHRMFTDLVFSQFLSKPKRCKISE